MVHVLKKAIRLAPAVLLALAAVPAPAAEFGAARQGTSFTAATPAAPDLDFAQINRATRGKWIAGETSMTRLAPEERRARLGLQLPAGRFAAAATPGAAGGEAPAAAAVPLAPAPPALDWRNNGGDFVTAVRDQSSCGSCWAFAAAGVLESKVLISRGTPGEEINLSEQTLLACQGPVGDIPNDCQGGSLTDAAEFIQSRGLPLESCYPYANRDGKCSNACPDWQGGAYRIDSFIDEYNVPQQNRVQRIKDLVANYGPIAVGMNVWSDFYAYTSGVYANAWGTYQGGHAVVVIGYSDAGQYFLVKNSWGRYWGAGGLFQIAYSQTAGTLYGSGVAFGSWVSAYGNAYLASEHLPDLVCSGFPDLPPPTALTAGDPASIVATISNTGPTDAAATSARLWLSKDGDTRTGDDWYAGAISVPPIAAGAAADVPWTIAGLPSVGRLPREVRPIVVVDSGRDVFEANEANKFVGTAFTVEPPVWVRVLSPNGREILARGQPVAIDWEGTGCGTVDIHLRRRTAYGWRTQLIEAGVPAGDGTYAWTVPDLQRRSRRYKVRLICADTPTARDLSDRFFRIQ